MRLDAASSSTVTAPWSTLTGATSSGALGGRFQAAPMSTAAWTAATQVSMPASMRDAVLHEAFGHGLGDRVAERREDRALGACRLGRPDEASLRPAPGGLVALVRPGVVERAQGDVEVLGHEGAEDLGVRVVVVPREHLVVERVGGHDPLVDDRAQTLRDLLRQRRQGEARRQGVGEQGEVAARSAHGADAPAL